MRVREMPLYSSIYQYVEVCRGDAENDWAQNPPSGNTRRHKQMATQGDTKRWFELIIDLSQCILNLCIYVWIHVLMSVVDVECLFLYVLCYVMYV